MRAPPAFHIFYATGWKSAVLHWRPVAGPGEPQERWQALPFHSTNSRARPKGGNWLTATICAEPLGAEAAAAAAAAEAEADAEARDSCFCHLSQSLGAPAVHAAVYNV